jgi:hypothetical protein
MHPRTARTHASTYRSHASTYRSLVPLAPLATSLAVLARTIRKKNTAIDRAGTITAKGIHWCATKKESAVTAIT